MESSAPAAVVHNSLGLLNQSQVLHNGKHSSEQTNGLMDVVQPTYESTYQQEHELERLHSCVQRPPGGTFKHTDLAWDRHIRVKRMGSDPRSAVPVSVAYIPWSRVDDFVKGEEARTDAPCKFICQGVTSHKHGDLRFPRWNSFSDVIRCLCNMSLDHLSACSNVTRIKQDRAFLHLTVSSTMFVDPIIGV